MANGAVAAWRCLCESAKTEADEQPTSQRENSPTPALSTGSAIGIEMCESELSAVTVDSLAAVPGGTGIQCSLLALFLLLSRAVFCTVLPNLKTIREGGFQMESGYDRLRTLIQRPQAICGLRCFRCQSLCVQSGSSSSQDALQQQHHSGRHLGRTPPAYRSVQPLCMVVILLCA